MRRLTVKLDEYRGFYFNGEDIRGTVIVECEKPTKCKKVQLHLRGKAQTSITKTNSAAEYFVRYDKDLFAEKDGKDELKSGTNKFPFTFTLPENCPHSFEGKYGFIRYWLVAQMQRPLFNPEIRYIPLSLVSCADLSKTPVAGQPVTQFDKKGSVGVCCTGGPLQVTMKLDKCGFVPGETVRFFVSTENQSTNAIRQFVARLHFHVSYVGSDGLSIKDKQSTVEIDNTYKVLVQDLDQSFDFKFPAVPPTFSTNYLSMSCELEAELVVENGAKMTLKFPLVVGVVPTDPLEPSSSATDKVAALPDNPIYTLFPAELLKNYKAVDGNFLGRQTFDPLLNEMENMKEEQFDLKCLKIK